MNVVDIDAKRRVYFSADDAHQKRLERCYKRVWKLTGNHHDAVVLADLAGLLMMQRVSREEAEALRANYVWVDPKHQDVHFRKSAIITLPENSIALHITGRLGYDFGMYDVRLHDAHNLGIVALDQASDEELARHVKAAELYRESVA